MNKNYFDIEKVLDKYDIDWESDSCIVCVNGIRNIGKTTNALNWLLPMVSNRQKIGFIRNTDEQLKSFKQDFNARYAGQYMISGVMVWSLRKVVTVDKEDNEVISYVKEFHIGYCASISTYTKIKSIEAANIRFILMDEYNEADLIIRNIYVKWINMVKTLSRFNKVFVLMLGNRDTPNNEFMVKWGVIPSRTLFEDDIYVKFSDRGHFIELGSKQFENLGNDKTLVNELAQFDKDSKRYLEGGYASKFAFQVVPYDKIIKNSFNPFFKFAIKGTILAFGEFNHWEKGKSYCLVSDLDAVEKATQENLQTYSLDSLSYQIKESKLNTSDSIYGMTLKLFREHKRGKLYYDSFDILQDIIDKMTMIKF